jgi:hypothetical protein
LALSAIQIFQHFSSLKKVFYLFIIGQISPSQIFATYSKSLLVVEMSSVEIDALE